MNPIDPDKWLQVRFGPEAELVGWLNDFDHTQRMSIIKLPADPEVLATWRDEFSAPSEKLLTVEEQLWGRTYDDWTIANDPGFDVRERNEWFIPRSAIREHVMLPTFDRTRYAWTWKKLPVEIETLDWLFDRDNFVPFTSWEEHQERCREHGKTPYVDPATKRPYERMKAAIPALYGEEVKRPADPFSASTFDSPLGRFSYKPTLRVHHLPDGTKVSEEI